MARQCLVAVILHQPETESLASIEGDSQQLRTLVLPVNGPAEKAKCEDLEKIIVGDDLEKFFQVGAQLPLREKEELIGFLRRNIGVFVWSAYEAPKVDPSFICHHLNVNPSVTFKKQPLRHSSKDHFDAVKDEVMKFKQAGAIKEVFYPEWLAKRSFLHASDKPAGRCQCRLSLDELSKCFLGIPSNTTGLG